jgi:hypothetical protein
VELGYIAFSDVGERDLKASFDLVGGQIILSVVSVESCIVRPATVLPGPAVSIHDVGGDFVALIADLAISLEGGATPTPPAQVMLGSEQRLHEGDTTIHLYSCVCQG